MPMLVLMISVICCTGIMPRLKQKLRFLLKNAARIAVVGIGSELRGDDAVGLLVLERLRKNISELREGGHVARHGRQPARLCPSRACAGQGAARPGNAVPPIVKRPILKFFNGGTAPENLTGEIRRFKPSHLIMIDAVDMGKKPGTIALLDLKNIESTAFLTHKLPVKLMLDYMAAEMTFTTIFIGIQPRSLEFEGKISKPVIRAGRQTADLLLSAAQSIGS